MLRPFTRSFYISLLTLTVWAGLALAQSTDKNFVLSRTYKSARTVVSNNVKEASQQITYLDGLGRPLQSISAHASPQLTGTTPHDLVSHTEYDAYGRVSKVYAPAPMTGNGAYHGDAGTNSVNYYNNGSNFNQQNNRGYALTEYEASPLNRVKKQFAVGSDRAVEFNYGVNGANEIKRYGVSGNSLSESETYGAGQLTFTQTLDENGNETKEFKDKNGRVVLKAANAGSGNWLNTYYVYDDLSQLRFVLQPQYQTAGATTDNYAFRYQYNDRGLVSSKYVPGGGTTTMTYDGRDRLTESTDGKGKPTYYKYDDLNRVIETGHKDGGTEHGLVKTYYDSYPGDSDGFLTAGGDYPGGYRSNVRGKVTFTEVRVINDDGSYGAWLGTTVYYDDRFNVIQTVRELFDLGSTDSKERVSRKLRFDGQVEKELTLQEKGSGNHSVEKIYSYDHGDRLLSTRYIVKKGLDTKKDITLAANRYDAIGQLKNKFLHATTGENNFREQLDYAYTPRSWMSKVTGKTGAGDNFGVELKYTNPVNTGAQFNGNIAEMLWRRSAGAWVGYKFVYDGANRLLNGVGIEGNTNEEVIAGYDKNGNITGLSRKFDGTQKDNLSYSYNGNQLTKVTDASGDGTGFNNGSSGDGDDFSYDGAGNATRDANRGIGTDGIKYNHLNLVRQVGVNGKTMRYNYDGAGSKLKMENGLDNTKYAGAFEYNNANLLTRIATEEGQINVTNNGNDFSFEYYLKDHLGNTRMVVNEAGSLVQETEYFPFGLAIPKTAGSNKYLYNGKEKQPETGLLDYGARQFDASIGRWMVADPLGELFESLSPYNYAENNPNSKIDPDGMAAVDASGALLDEAFKRTTSFGGMDKQLIAVCPSCPKDKAYDVYRKSDALFTYDSKTGIVVNGDGKGATVYGRRENQASTIGLPWWYGAGAFAENIPQIGINAVKATVAIPLMTLAFVLTPTPAGEGSTMDQYVLNSKGGKQNLWDDQLSPLSNQQLKEREEAAKRAKDSQLQQKIKKEWKRRGESNQQKRNSRGY